MGASQTHHEIRHVQILANYLKPLSGANAARHAAFLLEKFGSISKILSASREALLAALPDAPQVAMAIRAISEIAYIGVSETLRASVFSVRDPLFHDYLLGRLQHQKSEECLAVYLDRDGRYLKVEHFGIGTSTKFVLPLRQILQRALELGSSGFVLVHNHPSGCALPSESDRTTTAKVRITAESLDCPLVDHLIVANQAIYSMSYGKYLFKKEL
ncbi:JAB domain-containing protein [Aurantiacibacter zhengii]|uniref:JAB domain-containing protein n=1 Tax=Aurantiacibacter zhengii TaxID=2307003 RepID=UPI0013144A36|nr:JAB domain-containing protein [Aurantiacibacter zhengii]